MVGPPVLNLSVAYQLAVAATVTGVYSWLRPNGAPGYIGYTSGAHGYQALPLNQLNLHLPPFPKYMLENNNNNNNKGVEEVSAPSSDDIPIEEESQFDADPDPEENADDDEQMEDDNKLKPLYPPPAAAAAQGPQDRDVQGFIEELVSH